MDAVITDKKETGTMPRHSKIKCQKRSAVMLGMATNAGPSCCGTSSVFKIATTWEMEILKYADLLSCMKDNPYLPAKVCQETRKGEYSCSLFAFRQGRGPLKTIQARVCGNEIIPLP